MKNKQIEMVKNCIEELKDDEFMNEFAKLLYEANNPEYGQIIIYYDFDECSLVCEAMTQGTTVSNSVYLKILPQSLDFEEMSKKEYNIFVENLIKELDEVKNWIFYDEKGEKQIL